MQLLAGSVILAYGEKYQIKGLTATGTIEIIGSNATLSSVASDNTTPIIKNETANGLSLSATSVKFEGKNKAIEMRLDGSSPGVGLSLSLNKCKFQGFTRVSDAIYLRQIDFVELNKIDGANYDKFITIESDYTIGERDNTQIQLKNISLLQVKLGAKFRQIDKAVVDGLDINMCGGGIYLHTDNKRMQFNSCHVEHYGAAGYEGSDGYGYGYYLPDDKFQVDNSFNNCTSLLPEANALGGFYLGQSESLLTNVLFDNCNFAHDVALTNHKAVYLYGSYTWKGRFPYDNTNLKRGKVQLQR